MSFPNVVTPKQNQCVQISWALQADLHGLGQSYQRTLIGRATEMLPFSPMNGVARTVLKFLLTSAQLHAINEARLGGDLRMELEVTGTLPQAPG